MVNQVFMYLKQTSIYVIFSYHTLNIKLSTLIFCFNTLPIEGYL